MRGLDWFSVGTLPGLLSAVARTNELPNREIATVGFRVASRVPEPASLAQLLAAALAVFGGIRRFRL